MRKARFVIDFLDGYEFEGHTMGEEWNGFACPYFTFDEGQRLVNVWRERGGEAKYDNRVEEFTFVMDDSEEQKYGAVEVEGMRFFPIGAFSWIWEETDKTLSK